MVLIDGAETRQLTKCDFEVFVRAEFWPSIAEEWLKILSWTVVGAADAVLLSGEICDPSSSPPMPVLVPLLLALALGGTK